ncbi:MAG: diguanylate cyclase, partial [Lachnospiraceae bacterium]|nr:diguanylate cyclase [Lachnospiraceae bacterium]
GEEFLVVFNNSTLDTAYRILHSIADEIRNTKIIYENKEINITMTFGIVEGNSEVKEYDIIREADKKLYSGKNAGRDRIVR